MNSSLDKPWWQLPFKLEHGRLAYFADLWFYALASVGWILGLVVMAWSWPTAWQVGSFLAFAMGLLSWSLLEYGIHRFVFHGVQPFQRWHQAHHDRPRAFIASPTWVSVGIFLGVVVWPAYRWTPIWLGLSLSGGIFAGSAAYSWVHHYVHQHRTQSAWMMSCKVWHALHHRPALEICYGVTSPLWDKVFKTTWDGQKSRSG